MINSYIDYDFESTFIIRDKNISAQSLITNDEECECWSQPLHTDCWHIEHGTSCSDQRKGRDSGVAKQYATGTISIHTFQHRLGEEPALMGLSRVLQCPSILNPNYNLINDGSREISNFCFHNTGNRIQITWLRSLLGKALALTGK